MRPRRRGRAPRSPGASCDAVVSRNSQVVVCETPPRDLPEGARPPPATLSKPGCGIIVSGRRTRAAIETAATRPWVPSPARASSPFTWSGRAHRTTLCTRPASAARATAPRSCLPARRRGLVSTRCPGRPDPHPYRCRDARQRGAYGRAGRRVRAPCRLGRRRAALRGAGAGCGRGPPHAQLPALPACRVARPIAPRACDLTTRCSRRASYCSRRCAPALMRFA